MVSGFPALLLLLLYSYLASILHVISFMCQILLNAFFSKGREGYQPGRSQNPPVCSPWSNAFLPELCRIDQRGGKDVGIQAAVEWRPPAPPAGAAGGGPSSEHSWLCNCGGRAEAACVLFLPSSPVRNQLTVTVSVHLQTLTSVSLIHMSSLPAPQYRLICTRFLNEDV